MTTRQQTTRPTAKARGKTSGVTAISVGKLRSRFGVSRDTFARMTGFSTRSIASWETSTKPSAPALQRIREFQRLITALSEVITADAIPEWLQTPNPAFEERTPAEVISNGEADRIWEMVFRLRSGIPG